MGSAAGPANRLIRRGNSEVEHRGIKWQDLKSQVACTCHFKPAAMRSTNHPHENAVAKGTPQVPVPIGAACRRKEPIAPVAPHAAH